MKYKVGDKVRIRKDLEVGKDYGKRAVVPEMTNLKGMMATIKSVGRDYYEIEEDIDLFDWTDEMIEGLWEECGAVPDEKATVENFKKQQNKYKLIDILNKIANGELKEGTIVMLHTGLIKGENYKTIELVYRSNYLRTEEDESIFETMNFNILSDEVELIEPQEPKECEHEWVNYGRYNPNTGETKDFRKCAKCDLEEDIEPTDNTKIEELKGNGRNGNFYTMHDWIVTIEDKLNEVIRYINKGAEE